MVSQNLERFHVFRVAPHNSFHEDDFDVKVTDFSVGPLLILGTAFLGHTTLGLFPRDVY